MLLKCCTQYASKFGKTQQWPQDWKRSVFIPVPKEDSVKECSHYQTIVLTSHASKVMLKILQARLQQYSNQELPDIQAEFRKGRGTRDQVANIHWIIEKAGEFQKNYLCFIDNTKAFNCVDHNKLWKILKEMGISHHLTWQLRRARQSSAERSHPTSEVRGRRREEPMPEGRRPTGVTPRPRSGAAAESARLRQRRNGGEQLPHVRGQGAQPRGDTPCS